MAATNALNRDELSVNEIIRQLHDQNKLDRMDIAFLLAKMPSNDRDPRVILAEVSAALRERGYLVRGNRITTKDAADGNGNLGVDAVDGAEMSLSRFQAHLNEAAAGRKLLPESRVNAIVDDLTKPASGSRSGSFSLSERRADELAGMLENPHRASRQPAGAFSLGAPRDRSDEVADMLASPYRQRPAAAFSLDGRQPLRGALFFDEAKQLLTDEEFNELLSLFAKSGEEKRDERRARLRFIMDCLRKHHESRASV